MSTKEEDYKSLTLPLLRDELRNRGLTVGGNKPELINRLLENDAASKKKAKAPEAPKTSKAKAVKEVEAPKTSKAKAVKEAEESKTSKPKAPKAKAVKEVEAPKTSKAKAPKDVEKPKTSKAKAVKEVEAPKTSKKAKAAKISEEDKPPKVSRKPSKSEGAVPKSKSKKTLSQEDKPKKTPLSAKGSEEEQVPVKVPAKSKGRPKARKSLEKSEGEKSKEVTKKTKNVAKSQESEEERPVVKPFADPIPPEYQGKTFKVTSEQLYEALKVSEKTGAFFVAISIHEEVPIRPLWNKDVKAPVDSDGFVYDETVQMVVGKLENGKVRNLTQKEALDLENRRILVVRRLGELPSSKPESGSSSTSESEPQVESAESKASESEIDEGKSEGEEVEGRFEATVGQFTKATGKVFTKPHLEEAVITKPQGETLNERDKSILSLIKDKRGVSSAILLKIVQKRVADATLQDIERLKKK
jgi:hypothetical protein